LEDRELAGKFLSVINSEADRMTRLVKDLLQLSRLDNNQMKWDMQKISFEDLVRNCVEKVKFESEEKNQTLECFTIGEELEIVADKDRMEQVVLNILTNAIKYTPEGGKITVYIGRMYSEVYVKVVDSGIGIPRRILAEYLKDSTGRTRPVQEKWAVQVLDWQLQKKSWKLIKARYLSQVSLEKVRKLP